MLGKSTSHRKLCGRDIRPHPGCGREGLVWCRGFSGPPPFLPLLTQPEAECAHRIKSKTDLIK